MQRVELTAGFLRTSWVETCCRHWLRTVLLREITVPISNKWFAFLDRNTGTVCDSCSTIKISPPGFSNRWLFIDLLNLFLAYLEALASFIVLIFSYREKQMGQLGAVLITSQFELLDVAVLHWKWAVAVKVSILENTWWLKNPHASPPQNCLSHRLIEREVI